MNNLDTFLYRLSKNQKNIVNYFNDHFVYDLHLTFKIRYKIPFFFNRSWICYLNPVKPDGIELAFTRGNELSNIQGILDSKGRKQISGIVINSLDRINIQEIREIIQEAILLDETTPYSAKRK